MSFLDGRLHLVPLYGHTVGHCGVGVETDDGHLLHVGDSFYAPGELDQVDAPNWRLKAFHQAIHHDEGQARETQRRLKAFREAQPAIPLICSHDAKGWEHSKNARD